MKAILLSFAAVAGLAVANAATINVGQGFGTNVGVVAQTSSGTVLSNGGYYIAIGSFATVPTVVPVGTDSGASFLAAVNSFNIFTSLTSPTAAGATQGSITGAFTSTGGVDPAVFNLKQIYFLVGNGSTKENSTEFGIFSVVTTFPANVAQSGATAVTVGGVTNIVPLLNAGGEFDTIGGRDTFLLINPVPEPSTALLGLLGLAGLLRRRR
jgi:hypothetical protein